MSTVNAILRAVFDAVLAPFSGLPPWVGLTLVSAVIAVVMLLVFKKTSNQAKIDAVKQQIFAGLFEIRLFNDDFLAILRAQKDILRHNGRYFLLTLAPMLWLMVPLVLVIAQLQFHYGYAGLAVGEPVLLQVDLAKAWDATLPKDANGRPAVTLTAPAGVELETPAIWLPAANQLAWRLHASQPGSYELQLQAGTETVTKSLVSSEKVVRRSPSRVKGFLDQLLYPAEEPLPAASPIDHISLAYAETDVDILGFKLHWMIWFFILSLVFAFALKGVFDVTI